MRLIANSEQYQITDLDHPSVIPGVPRLSLELDERQDWMYKFDPSELDELMSTIMTGLCSMLETKAPYTPRISSISAREVENYLREKNEQPVFELTEDINFLVKNSLERWSHRGIIMKIALNRGDSKVFWPKEYISQIKILNEIFTKDIKPVFDLAEINVDLIALEGLSVVISIGDESNLKYLETIKWFLEEKIEKVSLNIVAEEESPS